MVRTRRRAFVSGALPHTPLWLLADRRAAGRRGRLRPGVALNADRRRCSSFSAPSSTPWSTRVWLKRRTWLNIVIGGLSGSFAVLAGAAAVDPTLGALPLLLALVLFLWTPPHFWSLAIAYQADYAAAGVPMLPVVVGHRARGAHRATGNTVALVAVSLLPVFFGAGPDLPGSARWPAARTSCARPTRWRARPSRETAMASFFASMVQLSVLLAAVAVDAAAALNGRCLHDACAPRRFGLLLAALALACRRCAETPHRCRRSTSAARCAPARPRSARDRARLHAARPRGPPGAPVQLPRQAAAGELHLHRLLPGLPDQHARAARGGEGPATAASAPNQFNVVSIGFNQPFDSPAAMRAFAAAARASTTPNWEFLSPPPAIVEALTRDFGFSYVATPAGFDHVLRVTRGRRRRAASTAQVYGDALARADAARRAAAPTAAQAAAAAAPAARPT